MSPRRIVLSTAVLLGLLACGTAQEVSSVGPQSPRLVPPGLIQGPYVQAGTVFAVALDGPIDTFYSQPGTKFTATVKTPLRGLDGRELVSEGAKVRGTVESVGEPDLPALRVQLDSIDTVAGTVPLHAAVRGSQHFAWQGPPTPEFYSSYVYPYDFLDYGTASEAPGATSAGRTVEGRTLMQPREIDVPAGAVLQLQLIEALVLPGAHLAQ